MSKDECVRVGDASTPEDMLSQHLRDAPDRTKGRWVCEQHGGRWAGVAMPHDCPDDDCAGPGVFVPDRTPAERAREILRLAMQRATNRADPEGAGSCFTDADVDEFAARLRPLLRSEGEVESALEVLEAHVWREPEHNACGINGGSAAVRALETLVRALRPAPQEEP